MCVYFCYYSMMYCIAIDIDLNLYIFWTLSTQPKGEEEKKHSKTAIYLFSFLLFNKKMRNFSKINTQSQAFNAPLPLPSVHNMREIKIQQNTLRKHTHAFYRIFKASARRNASNTLINNFINSPINHGSALPIQILLLLRLRLFSHVYFRFLCLAVDGFVFSNLCLEPTLNHHHHSAAVNRTTFAIFRSPALLFTLSLRFAFYLWFKYTSQHA